MAHESALLLTDSLPDHAPDGTGAHESASSLPDLGPPAPNLFVIGASKSGSSALHAYLKPHPDICMSSEKEPCFFVDQSELERAWPIMARRPCSHDPQAYLALWKEGATARYRGEGSVYYSQAPHRSGVPARIAEACPDARIIYTVREPVTRAISHYWQRYKEFQEVRPIGQAVREDPLYRDTSDYALQLQAYLQYFDREQIHVVVAEELRTRRREVLASVIDWLGLAPFEYHETQLSDRHRSPPTSRRQRFAAVRNLRDSALWAILRTRLPRGWIDWLRESSTVTFDKAEVDESEARQFLSEYLNPRRAAFEDLIGRKLDMWDEKPRETRTAATQDRAVTPIDARRTQTER
ncbi:sulfotransferase family protein [Novosphingobium pentaromativorans]|uniref:sulfotransferase family protein n=1 Tax=Novosphingobium pentaromativorans TaxID=205844 RepID=UPI0003083F26|nr:sulfotransferase [Novosphingobium pentaromativorans]